MTDWAREQQRLHAMILGVREVEFRKGMRVLDLGCGDGSLVEAYRHVGFEAYGCDFDLSGADAKLLPIARQPYRLPFPDRWFDVVVSQTVMEHVQNWDETLSEVARVTKPRGCSLHLFPARLRPIEPHVLVPFAGVLRPRWWLRVWARAGVRNRFQHGITSAEVVARNESFLNAHTTYPTRRQVKETFLRVFSEVRFCDREMIAYGSGRARMLRPLSDRMPAIASAYGTLAMSSVLAWGPRRWLDGD